MTKRGGIVGWRIHSDEERFNSRLELIPMEKSDSLALS